jgi:hypothetical protein
VQPQQELRTVGMPWKGMATRYGSEEMARRVMASWPWIRGRGRLWRREQPGVGRREGARPGAEWSAVGGRRPREVDEGLDPGAMRRRRSTSEREGEDVLAGAGY